MHNGFDVKKILMAGYNSINLQTMLLKNSPSKKSGEGTPD